MLLLKDNLIQGKLYVAKIDLVAYSKFESEFDSIRIKKNSILLYFKTSYNTDITDEYYYLNFLHNSNIWRFVFHQNDTISALLKELK